LAGVPVPPNTRLRQAHQYDTATRARPS
jgi:hypothetical protein